MCVSVRVAKYEAEVSFLYGERVREESGGKRVERIEWSGRKKKDKYQLMPRTASNVIISSVILLSPKKNKKNKKKTALLFFTCFKGRDISQLLENVLQEPAHLLLLVTVAAATARRTRTRGRRGRRHRRSVCATAMATTLAIGVSTIEVGRRAVE